MIPVKLAVHRIRGMIHDWQHVNYSDREILDVLNFRLRFIRRTIAEIQPEILMSKQTGILQAGEDEIKLNRRPMMIIEMTAGDKIISCVEGYSNKKIFRNHEKICGNKTPICSRYEIKTFAERPIYETNIQHVRNRIAEGHSRGFYRVGLQGIKIFPKPRSETAWTIRTVDDIEDLTFEDTTPLLNEFDDFLLEFAAMRLNIGNEFDMTQEQQIMANIHAQISQILSPPPVAAHVRGYW